MKKIILIAVILLQLTACSNRENYFEKSWSNLDERVWVGPEFWANRLQDWKIQNNRLECIAQNQKLLMRTTHLINYRLKENGDFFAKIEAGALQDTQNDDAAFGFLLGAGGDLDVWGASLIQQNIGPGAGIFVGISASGSLFVRDMETGENLQSIPSNFQKQNDFTIEIMNNVLTLACGDTQLRMENIEKKRLAGNIALVSHPGKGEEPGSFWFNNLEISGNRLKKFEQTVGPIISSQYTLSNDILTMTAQMVPVSKSDPKEVFLEVNREGTWEQIATCEIITPGYTATFRVPDWNSSSDLPYRVKYNYRSSNTANDVAYWNGTVRHDPKEKEEIVIAGFTGNHNMAHPGLANTKGTFNFDPRGIWYPHTDIVENVGKHKPDVLFFSGDQIYENHSPTLVDKENYELDYLYKWYLYCLAYRNLTKDIPTISIPDDHDVYQGNLWGQNGRKTDKDDKGGYVHPAWFVKMVERTQCSNLPAPYDPTLVDQGIGVYYTDMTYGGIGFAVIEDRKFKSGCSDNPFITAGRPDHVIDPKFDVSKIDLPGKKLLGDRQLEFLNNWTVDWKGQDMKIVLSQTIFANMATHHGPGLQRLVADLDSNGWSQTGRDKAVDALRKSFAFHLAGDQHLGSIVHHGIDEWSDGMYSFCVPSIANFYPRAWWPESIGKDRSVDMAQNMGKHKDGFGNYVTVYGVTNPTDFTKISTEQYPLELYDKAPGYGIVKMNKTKRTIKMECWPRYANPLDESQQYTGWPKTISQFDNYGRKAVAYLPTINIQGLENPVIEIRNAKTGELIYCVRISGSEFRPKVFEQTSYNIIVKDTETGIVKVLEKVVASTNMKNQLVVKF